MTLLTELQSGTDVITYLNAQWNTDVIAKPSMKEGFYGDIVTSGNSLIVGWDQFNFEYTDLGTQNDKCNNYFEIILSSDSNSDATGKTNLLKMLSETRRIINRSITNGEWHVDSAIPRKFGHEQLLIVTARQTISYLGD